VCEEDGAGNCDDGDAEGDGRGVDAVEDGPEVVATRMTSPD